MKAVNNIKIEATATKATEKAIAITVCYNQGSNENIVTKWLPKSQIVIEGTSISIPTWIVRNMFNELNIGTYATIGNTSICKLDII